MARLSFRRGIPQSNEPPKTWLGILSLMVGIFLLLVYFNIIFSQENQFNYGRIPIFFVGIAFSLVGVYIIWYNKNPKIVETYIAKIFGLIFYLSILAPFHIVLYEDYLNQNIPLFNFILKEVVAVFTIGVFDLILIFIILHFIYKRFKSKEK